MLGPAIVSWEGPTTIVGGRLSGKSRMKGAAPGNVPAVSDVLAVRR